MIKETDGKKSTLSLFRGPLVWTGIAFAVAGFLAEQLVGSEYAFECFMLFGGLYIGMGCERNRRLRADAASAGSKPSDQPVSDG
jgi:hypothetical protein